MSNTLQKWLHKIKQEETSKLKSGKKSSRKSFSRPREAIMNRVNLTDDFSKNILLDLMNIHLLQNSSMIESDELYKLFDQQTFIEAIKTESFPKIHTSITNLKKSRSISNETKKLINSMQKSLKKLFESPNYKMEQEKQKRARGNTKLIKLKTK